MKKQEPQEQPRGVVDSRATDQPPGYSAPLTRRQWISLIIPAAIFITVAVVLIYGLSSSAASGPRPSPTPLSLVAGSPMQVAAAAIVAATETLPVAMPSQAPTVAPTATLAPTETVTPAPSDTAIPTVTAPPTDTPAPTATETPDTSAAQPLLGKRVALDPGHGPRNDLGAVYVNPDTNKLELTEHEVNLDVALRARDLLVAMGAVVSMTRETRETFTLPWKLDTNDDGIEGDQADDLQQRIDIINASKADVFLSIHMNSHADPNRRQGIQALYCATEDCEFAAQNKSFGIDVLDQLEQQLDGIGYQVTKRELRSDIWQDTPDEPIQHLFLLGPALQPRHPRAIQMPGVIVEALYITSPTEVEELKLPEVRQAIAQAYANAVAVYLTTPPQ